MTALRIATVPDAHPYLSAVAPDGVVHVDFPGHGGDGDPWAPSPLLGVTDLESALADVDVLHVHFGYESLTEADMGRWVRTVGNTATALVVTVHDLRNPHDVEPGRHDAHLGALVRAADAVITLTPGAAREIRDRWQRSATVLPHPTLLGETASAPAPPRDQDGRPRIGLHLKGLRRNIMEPGRLVLAAAHGARRAGAVLQVDLHPNADGNGVAEHLRASAADGLIDLRIHERFSDAELHRYLRELDVSVLPYRFGTHSGWLELCRDLGTAVVAPDCGYYSEQWPTEQRPGEQRPGEQGPGVRTYRNNERAGLHEDSLGNAIRAALADGRPAPADRAGRMAQRDEVRAAHGRLYADAVARARLRRHAANRAVGALG